MIAVKNKPSRESLNRLWSVTSAPKRSAAALAVFLLIMVTALVFSIISLKKGDGGILEVVLCVVTICAVVIYITRLLGYPAKRYAAMRKNVPDMKWEYTFNDNFIALSSECTGISEHTKIKYAAVKKAVYRECWFVVVFGTGTGIAFHENSFTNGTPQELSALLREKLGKKYRVK